MKLKEKMKNNNHKKFDKKKLIGTISKKHIKKRLLHNGYVSDIYCSSCSAQHDRKCDSVQIFRN